MLHGEPLGAIWFCLGKPRVAHGIVDGDSLRRVLWRQGEGMFRREVGAWGRGGGAVEGTGAGVRPPSRDSLLDEVTYLLLPLTYHLRCYSSLLTKHIICLMRSFASLETLSSLGKVYRQSTIAWCVCMLLSRLQSCRVAGWRRRVAGWGTSGYMLDMLGHRIAGGGRVGVVHTEKG